MDSIENYIQTSGVFYHVRLTDPGLTLQRTIDIFDPISDRIIVSQEGGGDTGTRLHQHILIAFPGETDDPEYVTAHKTQIKFLIRQVIPGARGNRVFSIKQVRNKKQFCKYIVKDGHYLYKGFSQQFIDQAVVLSFSQDNIKRRLQQNKDRFLLGEINIEEYATQLLLIKGDAEQPIMLHHLKAHLMSMTLKRNPEVASSLARGILDELFSHLENRFGFGL